MLRLDHVMYLTRDLEDTARRLRFECGLDSYPGGEHSGVGTHNRIIPLGGDQYVALMAVADPDVAAGNPVGSRLLDRLADGEGLRVWCVSTDDIDVVCKRLDLEPLPWTRVRPDGVELRWRLAGVERAFANPSLPFFIQWDIPAELHPGRESVDHTVDVLGVAWLEVGGDAGTLDRWTAGADLGVRVVDDDEGPRSLGVVTAEG